DGAWLRGAVGALRDGGCGRVWVVLGSTGPARRGDDERWLVCDSPEIAIPEGAQWVWAPDWAVGLAASLRAGLAAVAGAPESAHSRTLIRELVMRDIADDLLRVWHSGRTGALATLVRTFGPSLLPIGSAMLVDPDGRVFGSVSDGCYQSAIYDAAVHAARTGR